MRNLPAGAVWHGNRPGWRCGSAPLCPRGMSPRLAAQDLGRSRALETSSFWGSPGVTLPQQSSPYSRRGASGAPGAETWLAYKMAGVCGTFLQSASPFLQQQENYLQGEEVAGVRGEVLGPSRRASQRSPVTTVCE